MKEYKYSGVNFLTKAWSNLKPFQIITKDQYWKRYLENYDNISKDKINWSYKTQPIEMKNTLIPPTKPTRNFDVIECDELLYIPLPYEFFDDYMTSWSEEVCYKYSKTCENKERCDCQNCYPAGYTEHLGVLETKKLIKQNKTWESCSNFRPWSYGNFSSIRDIGLLKPIQNCGTGFPQGGTHRILFMFMSKSDVPCFFNATPPSKYIRGDDYIINGFSPYFSDGKYCSLVLKSKLKKVEFYLNFHYTSFDRNREEKVGEIYYK